MKYNFDELVERRGTNCVKWDERPQVGERSSGMSPSADVIPLWVADMDFKAAPAILEAVKKRAEHGVFGYNIVPESYYEAVISWFHRRHQWEIQRQWILYTTAVVPAMSCVIKALTMPGEKVLILSPAYNCFFSSIKNNGCEVLESPLKAVDDSKVVSDEIHCELVMPGHQFVPFGTITDNCVVMNSPSKNFNTAGLQIANIICSHPSWRRRIDRAININEVCDVNPFGIVALQAAYNESEDWIDELNQYLWGNYQLLRDFIGENLPQWKVCRLEGTYLPWVDISAMGITSQELCDRLLAEAKVWINPGTMYGPQTGEGYVRFNIAIQRSRLLDALQRIKAYLG